MGFRDDTNIHEHLCQPLDTRLLGTKPSQTSNLAAAPRDGRVRFTENE